MSYPLPLTRTEAYLAYKAGVIQQSDLKPSLAVPRNGIDAWLAYWTGLTDTYPVKKVGKNLFSGDFSQFDNTGGVGSLYAYFKLPDDGVYTLTLIAKNDVTGTSGTFFGFTTTGGDGTNPRNWVFYQGLTMTKGTTRSVTNVNGGVNQHYVSLYLPSSDTLQWFMDNFEIQLEKGSATGYEPYTGGPLILQEEEAYIAYLCGVINEYPEKCLRRVGAYLRYLISARWGRPDHPLNREELYLSLIKTQFIPSGDPSSDIVIDGTAKAPFVDVKMYGDTYQQSYTGKNLFNNKATPLYNNKASAEALPTGVRITTNTATAGGFCFVVFKICDASDYEGQTITLKTNMTRSSTNPARAYIGLSAADGTDRVIKESLSESGSCSYTIEQDTNRPCVIVALYSTNSGTPVLGEYVDYTDLQIEVGSTATSYEPFVGGQPSPSPSYPQPVQTVTGRQVVNVTGKNLLTSVWEPGSYSTVNGVKQDVANTYRTAEKVAVQSDTTYIVSRDSAGLGMNYFEYDANGNFLAYTLKSANQSITTGQTTKFITMSRSQTGGFEKMMLESGSTITAYEPYSSNAYEINLGKNLFDKDSYQVMNAYFNTSTTTITSNVSNRMLYIPCEPNTTYTVSKRDGAVFNIGYTDSLPAIGTSVNGIQGGSTLPSQTLTTGANAKYLVCRFYQTVQDAITQEQMVASIQIEKGSQATAYAPYFTPIELCKIGDYQDYIWKDGEDWKIHKATVSAIIDGSESWDTSGTNTFYVANIYSKIGNSIQSASTGEMYASHFTIADITSSNTLVGASLRVDAAHNVSNLRIRLQDMSGGVAGFRQMLSAKKPSIYARRLTPTDTTITDQTLIAQLEALVAGGAENGTTYIKVNAVSPNLPGLLVVEAPKYE